MLKYKIIHIMPQDKFIEPFINFMEYNFDMKEHLFLVIDYKNNYHISQKENVILISSLFLSKFKVDYDYSQKIILHGLFRFVPIFLFFNSSLLKKIFWIIWGHDLYSYKNANKNLYTKVYEYIRKKVITKIPNYVVYMKNEFELMKKVYNTDGKHFRSFVYLSNLYEENEVVKKDSSCLTLMVGNSASKTNCHKEIFDILKKYKNENIKVIVPLSYSGSKEYVDDIVKTGTQLFQDKFIPILDYMEYEKYKELLSSVDMALFNHNRQEGIGNTNLLISYGVKIYLRHGTSQYNFYNSEDIKVFDINDFDLTRLSEEDKEKNQRILKKLFSKESLKEQLKDIYDT